MTHNLWLTPHVHAAALLRTGDVPQLQPQHRLVIPAEHLEGEVHSDGGAVVLGEHLVHVALYDGRLTHSQVAYDQHFEQALVLHCCSGRERARRGMARRGLQLGSA